MQLRRPVLALVLALAPRAFAQAPPSPAQIDAAVERGVAYLSKRCAARFDQETPQWNERAGLGALALYTLVKSGADPRGELVQRLLLSISFRRVDGTYDAACTLLALVALDPLAHRPWIDELAGQLAAWQSEAGDWGYPSGGDLSNTQYAVLGLWAASRAGCEVAPQVWTRLAHALRGYGDDGGGFAYVRSSGDGGSGSMTAAGVGALAICEARLRRAGALPSELARELPAARERGLGWLARNFAVDTNPRSGAWHFYYLYGLERVGALAAAPTLGAHDWYDEGARFLLARQDGDGAWNGGADLSETCFALLFLRRATADHARGPATGESAVKLDSALRIASEGAGPLSVRVAGWNREAVRDFEWPGERGLGPHVVCVEYLVDGELEAVELGAAARPAGPLGFRTTLVPRGSGAHRVQARATLRMPGDREVSAQSNVLEVQVERAPPAWLARPRPDALANLAPRMQPRADASSTARPGAAPFGLAYDASYAVDGNPRTPWLAAASDARPQLALTFQKGERCRVVQVRAAVLAPFGPAHLSRPIALDVEVNGRFRGQIAMSPDPLQPMRLELDEATTIKRLDLRITSSAPSDACPLVGLGEVELFAERP